jgi:hypothetical protein
MKGVFVEKSTEGQTDGPDIFTDRPSRNREDNRIFATKSKKFLFYRGFASGLLLQFRVMNRGFANKAL